MKCEECGRYTRTAKICEECGRKKFRKKYIIRPEIKERDRKYQRKYRLEHLEERRVYSRKFMAKRRKEQEDKGN